MNWEEYEQNYTLTHMLSKDWDDVADFIAQIIVSKNEIISSLKNSLNLQGKISLSLQFQAFFDIFKAFKIFRCDKFCF